MIERVREIRDRLDILLSRIDSLGDLVKEVHARIISFKAEVEFQRGKIEGIYRDLIMEEK